MAPKLKPSYEREDLEAFDLLQHPVWVFDAERKAMYWANQAALELVWDSPSLQALLARDFATDMSTSAERRIKDLLCKVTRGIVTKEHWTFYPKGKASTIGVSHSGIVIDGGRHAILAEGELAEDKQSFDESSVRGVEMLRHLPVAVCEFDINGKFIFQNPEGMKVFGTPEQQQAQDEDEEMKASPESDNEASTERNTESNNQSVTDISPKPVKRSNSFVSRFCDPKIGRSAMDVVVSGEGDYNIEAEQYTTEGTRWFSIAVRRSKDPFTSDPIILYSARDITEIIQARKQTKEATLKSEFMSVMAHEIRTPLHQIIGYVDLLEISKPLLEHQLDYVKLVQSAAACLMAIINDLLDYTKLENGKVKLESIAFGPHGVINSCVSAFEKQTEDKGIYLSKNIDVRVPESLVGDPNRLRQILLNLLSNAIKFTDKGGVALSVSCVDDDAASFRRIRFEVADTGIGIEPDQQKLLFRKYQQANTSVSRVYGGTGLGLAICKGLVEIMGGTIGMESKVGEGTRVFLEITYALPAVSKALRRSSSIRSYDSNSRGGVRVLVAEDNIMNQKLIRSMLVRIGHTVVVVENGQAAIEEAKKQVYDFILMDIQMPVLDGIEATKEIRCFDSEVTIVGLTAGYIPADLEYYRSVGMDGCLGKPIRLQTLRECLS